MTLSSSPLLSLPPELLHQILTHLPLSTLLPSQSVSKDLRHAIKAYLDILLHLPQPDSSSSSSPCFGGQDEGEEEEEDKISTFLKPRFTFLVSASEAADHLGNGIDREKRQQQLGVWNRDTLIRFLGPWSRWSGLRMELASSKEMGTKKEEEIDVQGNKNNKNENAEKQKKKKDQREERRIWKAYMRPEACWRSMGLGLLLPSGYRRGEEEGGGRRGGGKKRMRRVAITRLECIREVCGAGGHFVTYWPGWRGDKQKEQNSSSNDQGFTLGMLWDLLLANGEKEGGCLSPWDDDWDVLAGKRVSVSVENKPSEPTTTTPKKKSLGGGDDWVKKEQEQEQEREERENTDWSRLLPHPRDKLYEDEGAVVLDLGWAGGGCTDSDEEGEPLEERWVPRMFGGKACGVGEGRMAAGSHVWD